MTIGEIFLIACTLAIIIITIFLVPLLIQLRKAGERAENLLANLNQEIPPLMKGLNESATELGILAHSLNRKVEEFEQILNMARGASSNFMLTADLFKSTLLPIIAKLGSFGAGLFAFISFIKSSRHKHKTED